MTQPTGIFTLDREAYHSDPAVGPSLSASIAAILCTSSPAHAKAAHPKLNPDFVRTEEAKFDVGTVVHAILLEQRPLEEVVVIVEADSWRSNAAKAGRIAARLDHKIPLLEPQVQAVTAMVIGATERIAAHRADPPLLGKGLPEQTLVWEEDGVVCRALLDWLHSDHRTIDDLKTTSASADPHRWTRTLFTIGADIQAAFYLRGLKAVTGVDAILRYIVVETYPPFALSVVSLGPDALAVANAKVEFAINRWRECLAADSWPAYPTEVCFAELPPWEESRWLEREAAA